MSKDIGSKGIDTTGIFEEFESTLGIDKQYMLDSIKQGLISAYKKNTNSLEENVTIEFDEKGVMHVYQVKTVVEKVENEKTEISLEDAKKSNKDYKIDDEFFIELFPKEFGRIAAQTARQVITQKIREKTKEMMYEEFKDKKGQIVTGLVQKVTKNSVILDLGKSEGIMPLKEQIPTEVYKVNDKIRACILSVEKYGPDLTKIIVSRASTELIRRAFELEIPEIYEGVIEIKSISRIPGERTKIAVYSENPDIDPVGSCVGQKGIRIQNIINELNGEKFDIIEWNEDLSTFIASALLPAQVLAVDIREGDNEKEVFAQVIVPDDQFTLAIGKSGHNVKLAALLTNCKIDIKSESQFREILKEREKEIQEIEE